MRPRGLATPRQGRGSHGQLRGQRLQDRAFGPSCASMPVPPHMAGGLFSRQELKGNIEGEGRWVK
eukprot:15444292-Alexandrium_andersonii.AAC.1